jgi:inorganic triphosphatase YgiF
MRPTRAMIALPVEPEAPPAGAPVAPSREPLEIELKLAVPEAAREAVRRRLNAYGTQPPVQLVSLYFDTPDRLLASHSAALRVRRTGGAADAQWIQTLKTGDNPAVLSRRGEWETAVPGPRPQLSGLADWPLERLLGEAAAHLAPVFRTQFERTARTLPYQEARIEVALDEGRIIAGRRSEPICEIELELLQGSPSAIFSLALDLIGRGRQALALRPSIESKAARGYRLAQRLREHPAHAEAEGFSALLQPHRTHLDVARRLVRHGVHLVLANAEGAALGEDLEYVHQARVALRRTRSALRVLDVAGTADEPIARDLRWMADCFGSARDWDVLLTQTLPSLRKAIEDGHEAQWSRLMERAQARRQRQRQRLGATLASARFARAALRLLQWAEEPAAPAPARLMQRARRAIDRGHQRLTAGPRDLAKLSPRGRHRLRILAKRQRYALELLAPLLSGGAPARTLKLLTRLQQLLGEINDVHVAVSMLPSLTRSRELVQRADRWSDDVVRRNLPKAQARLERLRGRGSGV